MKIQKSGRRCSVRPPFCGAVFYAAGVGPGPSTDPVLEERTGTFRSQPGSSRRNLRAKDYFALIKPDPDNRPLSIQFLLGTLRATPSFSASQRISDGQAFRSSGKPSISIVYRKNGRGDLHLVAIF